MIQSIDDVILKKMLELGFLYFPSGGWAVGIVVVGMVDPILWGMLNTYGRIFVGSAGRRGGGVGWVGGLDNRKRS